MLNTRQNLSKRDPKKLTLRRSLKAPAGHKFVSVDSSQIEARMLAFVAGEDELVEQFREGHDPYAELASKIFGISAKEIHDGAKSGDKRLKNYRNVGKTCILSCFAGDTEVLTDTGWKRIDSVSDNDKLWDGEQWQTHNGLICNGERNTINLDGINVTPDHMIFDGSSWITAGDCLVRRFSLNRALSTGVDALSTVPLNSGNLNREHTTLSNARIVECINGCQNITCSSAVRIAAFIVRLVTLGISKVSGPNIQIPNPAQGLANSQCCKVTGIYGTHSQARSGMNASAWCSVLAALSLTGFIRRTFALVRQQDVMRVPRRKPGKRRIKSIGAMLTSALTYRKEGDCSRGFLRRSTDAIIQMISTMKAMAAGVSSSALRAVENALPILSPCPAGTTPTLRSTELTMMEITKSATSNSLPERRMLETIGVLTGCRNESTSLKKRLVYDIRNVGPRHRFVVRTTHGALLVHNCGYGVGWKKFSDTLLRQGVRLADDLEKHAELAKQAHMIYRMSNASIVAFWDTCQQVVEAMCSHVGGTFGAHNEFEYGYGPIAGTGVEAPYIELRGTGYRLWYPNLRWEKGERGRAEYFYDRPRGKNMVKTKLYGGALTENCCSRGTLVLTDSGWKPIEAVSINDLVYDGSSFVRHSGVVSRGIQDCIEVNGCWFTSDHLLMENGEWVYAKDCERPDRIEVWKAHSSMPYQFSEPSLALGVPMRRKREAEVVQPVSKKAEVFDILNCGEQHCFTVKGNYPMLAHNCVQSIAFQLLMWQACEMDRLGIHLIANIHDAWLACMPEDEAEEAKDEMESIMSSVPPWLEEFPVACEGEIGDSYEIA